jgi:hypothetical protein
VPANWDPPRAEVSRILGEILNAGAVQRYLILEKALRDAERVGELRGVFSPGEYAGPAPRTVERMRTIEIMAMEALARARSPLAYQALSRGAKRLGDQAR